MIDTHGARELELFIDNDGQLYRTQTVPIFKNLATKRARGTYKRELAIKLFGHLVEAGAKKYVKDHGSADQPWHKMFNAATRRRVAEELTKGFEAEADLGNYAHLLPKKYQAAAKLSKAVTRKPAKQASHATKKLTWRTPESLKVVWSPVNSAYFALWPGRGPIKNQQVLKIAGASEMHDWLRATYGDAYGLAERRSHATINNASRKSASTLDRDIAAALATHRRGH